MLSRLLLLITFLCLLKVNAQHNYAFSDKPTDSLMLNYEKENKLDSIVYLARSRYKKHFSSKEYQQAIVYALKEVAIRKDTFPIKDYKRSVYNLGLFYYYNKEYNKSILQFKNVISDFDVDKKTYQAYLFLGRNYNKLHDYYQAIAYCERGLSQPHLFKNSVLYGHYINYAQVFHRINNKEATQKEYELLKKIDSLDRVGSASRNNKFSFYDLFAKYYAKPEVANYSKASYYHHKSIDLATKLKDTTRLIAAYNNHAILYNSIKKDSAFYYIKKGIELSQKNTSYLPNLHLNLAEYYSIKKEPLKAIKSTQDALLSLPSIKTNSNHNSIPKIEDALLTNNKALVWNILTDKSKYHLETYQATLNKEQARLALEHLIVADQLIDAIRFESFESQSKLVWQNYASETYILGVKAAHILNQNEKAFYFMEKSKAILLLENLSENQLKKQVNLPKAILEEELRFEKKINTLENQLSNSKNRLDSLTKQYYDYKIQFKNFIESLKQTYPEYYNFKAPVTVISLNEIQENLYEDDLVIDYILNETYGYILAISKESSHLYEIQNADSLKLKIESYLLKISQPFSEQTDIDSFNLSSIDLYKTLLPFLENKEFISKKNITIIPDYLLQNIPFESLKNSANNYLLNNYEINYGYSLSFLKQNETINRKAQNTFIGFSPNTFSDNKLTTLNNSEFEILDASNQFSGSTYLNDSATKSNFLSHSNDYKIIHLSTHADANDSIAPWIAFKHEKLFLNELYTTKTQAELVVLSACKSSLGDIKKGEGVFSLARGFFYTGANSVVSTLWNVNDKSTQEILSSFYTYLNQGETKSAALRLAKLDYINNNSHSEISPYYWSSLILVGDNSEITISTHNYIYLIILVVFLTLFFLLKKKKA